MVDRELWAAQERITTAAAVAAAAALAEETGADPVAAAAAAASSPLQTSRAPALPQQYVSAWNAASASILENCDSRGCAELQGNLPGAALAGAAVAGSSLERCL